VTTKPRRAFDKKLFLASIGMALGLTIIIFGFRTGLTGREASNLPDAIEGISPADDARVLRQSQVIVDFVDGYIARLIIDDIELPTTRLDELVTTGTQPPPGAQVDLPPTAIFDPGNYTISFLPQPGAPIEQFSQGEHTAKVIYWPIDQDESRARTYSWTFITD
jgi:hypothetical protein